MNPDDHDSDVPEAVRDARAAWNAVVSLAYQQQALNRHKQQADAELLAAVLRAGGRATLRDGREIVVRQHTTREYDPVRLDILCVNWRRNGLGPLAQQVEACQVVETVRVVEATV